MDIEKRIRNFIIKKNVEVKKISQLNSILHSILIYPNGIIGMVFLKKFFLILLQEDRFKMSIFKIKNLYMTTDYSQLYNTLLKHSNSSMIKAFIEELRENFYLYNDESKELDILFETDNYLIIDKTDLNDTKLDYKLFNPTDLEKFKLENARKNISIIPSKLFVVVFNLINHCLIGYLYVNKKEIALYPSDHNYIIFNKGSFIADDDPLIKVTLKKGEIEN
ncbi:hypothetical protein AL387_gp166 [Carp edema virus]|nr:hypothetical protein AL387_gp166 [Carp edema virus]